jgi:hypothetical protein
MIFGQLGRRLSVNGLTFIPLTSRVGQNEHIVQVMAEWWSIEVFHGEFTAARWKDAHDAFLVEAAISNGAIDWAWHEHRWGVVFEVAFEEDRQWESFRGLAAVRAALDAVPDPVNGLLIYRGRGGGAGALSPRRPRPTAGAGALALPEPSRDRYLDLTGTGERADGELADDRAAVLVP